VALVWNSYLSFSTRQLNDKDKPTEWIISAGTLFSYSTSCLSRSSILTRHIASEVGCPKEGHTRQGPPAHSRKRILFTKCACFCFLLELVQAFHVAFWNVNKDSNSNVCRGLCIFQLH
jgi:hypothetical protein